MKHVDHSLSIVYHFELAEREREREREREPSVVHHSSLVYD